MAGFVTPNTRVDVLLTIDDKVNTGGEPATRIIMQDVRALAAGQQIQPDKDGKPVSVGVVTFLLTPEQAETLALASRQGTITLALRNQLDTARVKTFGTRVSALLGGPIGRPRAAARTGPRPRRAGRGGGTAAEPDGDRSVQRRCPHVAEVLTSTPRDKESREPRSSCPRGACALEQWVVTPVRRVGPAAARLRPGSGARPARRHPGGAGHLGVEGGLRPADESGAALPILGGRPGHRRGYGLSAPPKS